MAASATSVTCGPGFSGSTRFGLTAMSTGPTRVYVVSCSKRRRRPSTSGAASSDLRATGPVSSVFASRLSPRKAPRPAPRATRGSTGPRRAPRPRTSRRSPSAAPRRPRTARPRRRRRSAAPRRRRRRARPRRPRRRATASRARRGCAARPGAGPAPAFLATASPSRGSARVASLFCPGRLLFSAGARSFLALVREQQTSGLSRPAPWPPRTLANDETMKPAQRGELKN